MERVFAELNFLASGEPWRNGCNDMSAVVAKSKKRLVTLARKLRKNGYISDVYLTAVETWDVSGIVCTPEHARHFKNTALPGQIMYMARRIRNLFS